MSHLGYCHNCACKVTTENIGVSIIAQKDVWCNKPACKRSAKLWLKKFHKQNVIPIEEKIKELNKI